MNNEQFVRVQMILILDDINRIMTYGYNPFFGQKLRVEMDNILSRIDSCSGELKTEVLQTAQTLRKILQDRLQIQTRGDV